MSQAQTVTISPNASICNGESMVFSYTESGLTAPITCLWDFGDGATSTVCQPTYIYTASGTYNVCLTLTDVNNVQIQDCISIDVFDLPVFTLSSTDVLCPGDTDGVIECFPQNPDWQYIWSNGATTPTVTGLQAGTYFITVSNAEGCIDIDDVVVGVPDLIEVTNLTVVNPSTANPNSGEISISVNGGVPPYTYDWSNFSTTASIVSLAAGDYTVTITDNNACQELHVVTLVEDQSLQITNINTTDVSCNGLADGVVTVNVVGGDGSYSYLWSDGHTTQTATGLMSGMYTVTVEDGTLATATSSVVINEPTAIIVTNVNVTDATCGNADGEASLSVVGGILPYAYNWGNGNITSNSVTTGLAAGTYAVTITDDNGCIEITTVTVNNDCGGCPTVNPPVSNGDVMVCVGDVVPALSVTADAGLEVDWYDMLLGGTQLADNTLDYTPTIPFGTGPFYFYAEAIDPITGCASNRVEITVIENDPPTVSIDPLIPVCEGETVTLSAAASTMVGFEWSDISGIISNATSVDVVLSTAGIFDYTVVVTDANGCTGSDVMAIGVDPLPTVTIDPIEPVCEGETTTLIANAPSGVSYVWSPPVGIDNPTSPSVVFAGAVPGVTSYTVAVTDANGCVGTASIDVTVLDAADCVWPGDANFDGVANNNDILSLGVAYGNSGMARNDQSIAWYGHPTQFDWDSSYVNGINHRHADCDGDGLVTMDDTTAIIQNYGLAPHVLREMDSQTTPLSVSFNTGTSNYGELIELEVEMADVNQTVDEIYGVAFSLIFNYPEVINPSTVQVDFSNSVIGNSTETITLYKSLLDQGRMDFAVTRFDHMNVENLFGEVMKVSFIIEDNIDGVNSTNYELEATIADVMAITASEGDVPFTPGNSQMTMIGPNSNDDLPVVGEGVDVYPNPVTNILNFSIQDGTLIESLRLYDVLGRELFNQKGNLNQLDMSSYAEGIYFLEIGAIDGKNYLIKLIKK